jgi:hypothetical protein
MGFDAVVYKHHSKLLLDPERAGLRMEPTTGEWYSERDQLPEPIKSAGVEALHRRLGNVSLISSLHTELAALLPADSVLLSSILYDGTHGGDVISSDALGGATQKEGFGQRPTRILLRVLQRLEAEQLEDV